MKEEKKEFNQIKYIQEYNKKNYVRKELQFRKEDWEKIKKYLEMNKITLKQIIYNTIFKN